MRLFLFLLFQKMDELMNHVILPRLLPDRKSRYYHSLKLELLRQMVSVVERLQQWIPTKTNELFQRLGKLYENFTPDVVAETINELQPGDSFAVFVRRQNWAIIIHRESTENAVVATFPGNLLPQEIYTAKSDLKVTFLEFFLWKFG